MYNNININKMCASIILKRIVNDIPVISGYTLSCLYVKIIHLYDFTYFLLNVVA